MCFDREVDERCHPGKFEDVVKLLLAPAAARLGRRLERGDELTGLRCSRPPACGRGPGSRSQGRCTARPARFPSPRPIAGIPPASPRAGREAACDRLLPPRRGSFRGPLRRLSKTSLARLRNEVWLFCSASAARACILASISPRSSVRPAASRSCPRCSAVTVACASATAISARVALLALRRDLSPTQPPSQRAANRRPDDQEEVRVSVP